MAMSGAALVLRDIAFAYGPGRPVLDGVSLCIEGAERVGLSGPIGSGKSTLIALALGLARPAAGTIAWFGVPCRTERDFHAARLRCGVLFQDPDDQIFCPTVGEDVAFGPLNQGLPRQAAEQRAATALAQVGLEDFADRLSHRLSGGEKRLVALAGALAMDPALLLLDEPLAGLDPETAARIVQVLDGLAVPMLIVSHQQAELAPLLTRRLRLHRARLEPTDC
jgi:cobalt/nickel transport system ATP-binding protein